VVPDPQLFSNNEDKDSLQILLGFDVVFTGMPQRKKQQQY
jgi:hypothetical protein